MSASLPVYSDSDSTGPSWPRLAADWRGVGTRRRTMLCCISCMTAIAAWAATVPAGPRIAIVYPHVGEPYRGVFDKIIEGIEERTASQLPRFEIGATPNTQEIVSELRRQDIRVVIALGRTGFNFASRLELSIGVVAGGVLAVPDAEAHRVSVQSLAPDPGLLFSRLLTLKPGAKRIFVVYDPIQNAWLMRLAKEAARERRLELMSYEARDLKTALQIYKEILATASAKQDVLWLPQDSATVDETLVLPLVLEESWARNLMFFSSNASHVKRGALFSLYPDYVEIGRRLANSAQGHLSSGVAPAAGVLPLTAVRLAVNSRTADHLGVALPARQSLDFVFPAQ